MINYNKINELLIKYPEFSDSKLARIYSVDTDYIGNVDTIRRKITFLREYHNSIGFDEAKNAMVVLMSDAHFGRVTRNNNYNIEFCLEEAERRMENVKKDIFDVYKRISITTSIDKLYIIMLGDMIDGEVTFPAQQMHVELPELKQVVVGVKTITLFIEDMKSCFKNIYVRGVYGNHAASRFKHELNKGDVYLYKFLEQQFKDDARVDVRTSETFYDIVTVNGWGFLMYHGHGIKNYMNLPFYGLQRWGLMRQNTLEKKWNYLTVGHFHTVAYIPVASFDIYMN
ncbi:MAG TPA: hypothetical protein PKV92_09280, partial [Thermodesulfovibrio thiophilus]|nr:hypothetical protein [Thermodesulfovibrio thiophilus]